jgi:hypothetical protein
MSLCRSLCLFSACLVCLSLRAEGPLRVTLAADQILESRLKDFPLANPDRQQRAIDLFRQSDCPKIVELPLGKKPYPANILCILPGENEKTILVGAHFDKVPPGEGKIDNASGVVLLSSLLLALKGEPRRHTFIFAAFAEEEIGLIGSRTLASKGLPDLKSKDFLASLSAMVNIDSVGAGVTAIAQSQSDKELGQYALAIGKAVDAPCRLVNVDQVGDSDGSSFKERKVRTIQFHSLDNDNFKILHSPKDTMQAFLPKEYYATYRLLAFYLAFLDGKLSF